MREETPNSCHPSCCYSAYTKKEASIKEWAMPSMTFRFTTECELTLDGQSYEDIYLKFKDICQSDAPFLQQHQLTLFPPEQSTVLFEVDEQNQFNAMELKGNFQQDIIENLPENWVRRIRSHPIKAVKT